MANPDVVELTDTNFETEVINSATPTLVDFWATWCGPCRQIAPVIDALATEYKGKVKIGKVDIDSNAITAEKYKVRSIPTLLVFKDGQVVGQLVGAVPKSKMEAELQKHL